MKSYFFITLVNASFPANWGRITVLREHTRPALQMAPFDHTTYGRRNHVRAEIDVTEMAER